MSIRFRYLISLFLLLPVLVQAQQLRMEPANWWVGMKNPELQILLYQKDIALSRVTVSGNPGVTLKQAVSVENPNYVFLYVHLASDIRPGSFNIHITPPRGKAKVISYPLLAREENSARRQGFSPADAVYLLMPDRFANGDPANDNMPGMLEKADRSNPNGRHGGDIAGISRNLDYIKELGMTAIWINPLLENNNHKYSYHGYAITDFYRVDPRFGTNEDYRNLVSKAHGKGLKIIQDMIFNHFSINHWMNRDLPGEGWVHQYPVLTRSNFRAESITDPYASDYDRTKMITGWFDSIMPDLDQRNPLLADYLIQNSIWWIEYAGIDGIRMDTQPYPYREMMADWAKRVFAEYPGFSIVGEAWLNREGMASFYQKDSPIGGGYNSNIPSITDFPLHGAMRTAFTQHEGWDTGLAALYYVLAQDFLYANPFRNLIFLDNHDLSRYFSNVNRSPEAVKMALAFLMTTRGIPSLYYGTELLMEGNEHEGHGSIRTDFPGGWADDRENAFTPAGRTAVQNEVTGYLARLANWRKTAPVIHQGRLKQFIPENGTYVYFRYDDSRSVMVVLNKNTGETALDLNRFEEGLKGYNTGTNIITGGQVTLKDRLLLPGMSATILELK